MSYSWIIQAAKTVTPVRNRKQVHLRRAIADIAAMRTHADLLLVCQDALHRLRVILQVQDLPYSCGLQPISIVISESLFITTKMQMKASILCPASVPRQMSMPPPSMMTSKDAISLSGIPCYIPLVHHKI